MKKLIPMVTKCFGFFTVTIFLIYIGIGFLGNFDLKSGACAGGFYSDFYRSEEENIKAVCDDALTDEELTQIQLNLSINSDNKKFISTRYCNKNGDEIKLQCKMNWYWSETYEWSIQQ